MLSVHVPVLTRQKSELSPQYYVDIKNVPNSNLMQIIWYMMVMMVIWYMMVMMVIWYMMVEPEFLNIYRSLLPWKTKVICGIYRASCPPPFHPQYLSLSPCPFSLTLSLFFINNLYRWFHYFSCFLLIFQFSKKQKISHLYQKRYYMTTQCHKTSALIIKLCHNHDWT